LPYLPLYFLFFKGLVFQKVFAFFMPIAFTAPLVTPAELAARWFMQFGEFWFWLALLILPLIVVLAYIAVIQRFGRRIIEKLFAYGSEKEWALYALVSVVFYVIVTLNRPIISTNPQYATMMLCLILVSISVFCFAIINTHDKIKHKYESELAQDIISSGSDHYQKMNEMHETLRVMRHDYKYHLDIIRELLNSGDKDETEKYLNDIQVRFSEKQLASYCQNSVLNALISSYCERCEKHDIKFTVDISMPNTITTPNYEMCIVLGNLLENAVEATTKLNTDRIINLKINTQNEHLAVIVKNSFEEKITEKDDFPVSSKKNGGLGLRSVQAVAVRYGGDLMTEWEGRTFTAYVLLKL
jgi:signal transduction histidine kinase